MAFTTKKVELTQEWQLLLDNTGSNANPNNAFYVNEGSAIFAYENDKPDYDYGMRISAGARIIPVPVNAKLWGKLNVDPDHCTVIVLKDE